MARVISGERVGGRGRLSVSCTAVIFDQTGKRILLTRRADNGLWCLPGGQMESGESVVEACEREVWEETGLRIRVTRLVTVTSNPHRLLEYPDGNRYQVVGLCFLAEPVGGALGLSDETTEVGYFTPTEIERMDLLEPTGERVRAALAGREAAIVH